MIELNGEREELKRCPWIVSVRFAEQWRYLEQHSISWMDSTVWKSKMQLDEYGCKLIRQNFTPRLFWFLWVYLSFCGFSFGRFSNHKTVNQNWTWIEAQSSKFARHPEWRAKPLLGQLIIVQLLCSSLQYTCIIFEIRKATTFDYVQWSFLLFLFRPFFV